MPSAPRLCRCADCSNNARGYTIQPYRRWQYHNKQRPAIVQHPAAASTSASTMAPSQLSTQPDITQDPASTLLHHRLSIPTASPLAEPGGTHLDMSSGPRDEVLAEDCSDNGNQAAMELDSDMASSEAEVDLVLDEGSTDSVEEGSDASQPCSDGEERGLEAAEVTGEDLCILHPSSSSAPVPPLPPRATPEPRHDSPTWVKQLHLFVLYLIAFAGISDRLATLITTTIAAIVAPALRRAEQGLNVTHHAPDVELTASHGIMVTPACIRRNLGMTDAFDRYAVCPACARMHLWNDDPRLLTASCLSCGRHMLNGRRPALVYSHRRLETILTDVLQDQRNEDAIRGWERFVPEQEAASERHFDTLWSGSMWKGDCSNHSHGTICPYRHMAFVHFEMHLKITLFIDWFSAIKGRYSGTHSSGVLLIRIDNLPHNLVSRDRKCAGIHAVGVLPGPREQTERQLMSYLQLVTDELTKLYVNGLVIKTARHPEGRLVKLKLGMILADSPARHKIAGFTGCRTKGKGCPYCLFDFNNLGDIRADTAEQRSDEHRLQSLACSSSNGKERHRHLGVKYSIINELPYFSAPSMCPPDYMHAIHLSLCKRFFHKLLVLDCGELGGWLADLQRVLKGTLLPSTAQRPDSRIGLASGGNPNAEQYLTLWQHQLVFGLMEIWAQSLSGAEAIRVHFDPEERSRTREVMVGSKPVEDIFEAAMLLTAIVDFMEQRSLMDTEVERLEELIKTFNRKQADLLGPGWLTYNNHIAEHIPEFIKRYGSPQNFSCYAFKSYNGILGSMRKTNRKGGALEDSLMRIASLRTQVEQQMRSVLPESMASRLEEFTSGTDKEIGQISETTMAKVKLEESTERLLVELLNSPNRGITGMYKTSHDPTLGPDDVAISSRAQHFHSLVKESFPKPVRISSAKQGGSVNMGNTYVVVPITPSCLLKAQVLWLFKKRLRLRADSEKEEDVYFAHIRQLEEADPVAVLGRNHPCLDLMKEINISFGIPGEGGREWVVPYHAIRAQLSVCRFRSIHGEFLGLKAV